MNCVADRRVTRTLGIMDDEKTEHLTHSALRSDLDFVEVTARFWGEVRVLEPNTELHVVDPYLMKKGRRSSLVYASNLAELLKPLLKNVDLVTLVYYFDEDKGVRNEIEKHLKLFTKPGTIIRFVRPAKFHHRWVIADRSRLALMDHSFNQIGDTLGSVDVVTKEADRIEYCDFLDHQDPPRARRESTSTIK